MGPGKRDGPGSYFQPPQLRSVSDKLEWREDVRLWVETIQAAATAGDPKAQGADITLGMSPYRSLQKNKKERVKTVLRTCERILKVDEDGSPRDQNKIIEKIINVVVKDSAVDQVRRIVWLNKDVTACLKKSDE